MKTFSAIKKSIENRLTELTGQEITNGSVIDLYNIALSEHLHDIYQEIENSKNPHLWSKLSGKTLDDMGVMMNMPRKKYEDDETYKYRIMNWILSSEKSNATAISDALLSPVYSSNISFYPYTRGSGTATCYIIPKDYSDKTIEQALIEAESIVKKTASPSLYVEYIIPEVLPVSFQIFISSSSGDIEYIKKNITEEIKSYVNSIAPGKYLEAGVINRIGISQNKVDFFNTMSIIVNKITIPGIKILQELNTKMLFDEIIWTEEKDS